MLRDETKCKKRIVLSFRTDLSSSDLGFKRKILSEETGPRLGRSRGEGEGGGVGLRARTRRQGVVDLRLKFQRIPAERRRKEGAALGKSTGSAALNCVIYISSPRFGCL